MAEFQSLSGSVTESEAKVSQYWKEIDLLKRTVDDREGHERFIFFEGPPTANGRPGIHHVIARALKDAVCRYKTMENYQVKRKAGWDTHGLPVEIEVEKKLGLHDKNDIEKYGIKEFCECCRKSVFEYESMWRSMTERMGYLIDLDHPYITLDNNYIESAWWALDKFFKEGMMYEGHKILPYCTRCGTGLASHEVAQGYKEIKVTTVTVKFKRKDADEYFLVWTTTPWTLASNAALTVNPDVTYVKVEKDGVKYWVCKDLAEKVLGGDDFTVLEECKGKDLEYVEYEQLMPFVKADKKAFFVTCADYVTTEDGTGIVHTAGAFGEDDYNTSRRYDLPILQPVAENGTYTETPWKGKFVMDADPDIIEWLYENKKLFKKEKMMHNYPHCWRCGTPLLYYAKPSWYIAMTKLKDQLVANNNTVEWYPPFVGEGRFGNWLANVNDWAISRSRYWGTPLNIWRCECGCCETIGSRKELVERAIEDIDESIELHRPYVDEVHITCPKCGKPMTRVKDVIDCWFDSGMMPFAQQHYPFEHQDDFDQLFPADFICEGIDQTRGWFYSLMAISTFLTGRSPYKRVLVNDLILDKDGMKMSKSKGNTVNPFEMFDKYGADALRWYLYYVSPAWTPTRFDEYGGLKDITGKFFGTLKNVYSFFSMYANMDGQDPREFFVEYAKRPEIDRWMLSRLNSLILYVRESLDAYDLTKAVRKIQDFVIEDLSNWYIRRCRRRFWASEIDDDKRAVYNTTYEVLVTVAQLIAPMAPFFAEELYRTLTGKESVHLSLYPEANRALIDEALEERMNIVTTVVTMGRALREKVKLKVRQPLAHVMLEGKYREKIKDLSQLIMEELNVKEVIFVDEMSDYITYTLKPNFRVVGAKVGKNMGAFGEALKKADALAVISALNNGQSVQFDLNGTPFEAVQEDITVQYAVKEGFDMIMENNFIVLMDTKLTPALIEEGLLRELLSKVQNLRKTSGFAVEDTIQLYVEADEELQAVIDKYHDFILSEVLATELIPSVEGMDASVEDINGHKTKLFVKRNK